MREFVVDEEMAAEVQKYIDKIRQYGEGNTILVEQRVPISQITGEKTESVEGEDDEEASGTADVVILTGDGEELQVHDLKYGRGVKVDAFEVVEPATAEQDALIEPNAQMGLYGLGALEMFGLLGNFKRVRLVIHQPRLDHLSEFDLPVEALLAWGEKVKAAAGVALTHYECTAGFPLEQRIEVIPAEAYSPGEKQCRWCKAKATCPALARVVSESVFNDFEILGDATAAPLPVPPPESAVLLGTYMGRLELIEDWCRAVRAKVESNLVTGLPVPGWKLVEGKKGNRAWIDDKAAEALLKSKRLKKEEMYKFTLISPTQAEKVLKSKPRVWAKVVGHITQPPGKLSVAPESDKRPAAAPAAKAEEFDLI